jgi:hypothetical protein
MIDKTSLMCMNVGFHTGVFIKELQENLRERAGRSLAYPGMENPMGPSFTCFFMVQELQQKLRQRRLDYSKSVEDRNLRLSSDSGRWKVRTIS